VVVKFDTGHHAFCMSIAGLWSIRAAGVKPDPVWEIPVVTVPGFIPVPWLFRIKSLEFETLSEKFRAGCWPAPFTIPVPDTNTNPISTSIEYLTTKFLYFITTPAKSFNNKIVLHRN
jgi:hypothetical protein